MGSAESHVRKDAGLAELLTEDQLLSKFTLQGAVQSGLVAFTGCTLYDIQDAFQVFEADEELKTPGLDRAGFCRVFDKVMASVLSHRDMERAFELFDADRNGKVDVYEVFAVMAVCSHATPNMKAKFMFRLYDFDGSEDLSKHELVIMLLSVLTGMSTATGSSPPPVSEIEFVSEVAFAAADTVVADGKLTYMEFFQWIQHSKRARAILSAWPACHEALADRLAVFNAEEHRRASVVGGGAGADSGDVAPGLESKTGSGLQKVKRRKQGSKRSAKAAVNQVDHRRGKRHADQKAHAREAAMQEKEDAAAVLIQRHWRVRANVDDAAQLRKPRQPMAPKTRKGIGARGGKHGRGGGPNVRRRKASIKKRGAKGKGKGGKGGKKGYQKKGGRKASAQSASRAKEHQCKYTKAEVLDLVQRYREMDADNSGSISFKEFRDSMQDSGLYKEALGMFIALDKDLSGEVTFEELLANLYPHANETDLAKMREWAAGPKEEKRAKVVLTKAQIEEMDAVFKLYDTDHSGTISVSELCAAMVSSGVFSQEDVKNSFASADIDHDGELSVAEFRDYFSDTYFVPTDYKLYDWTLKL